jgi:hypothetical protein
MSRKMDTIVELELKFSCTSGHSIRRTLTHVQEIGSHRLIENQSFDLECNQCDWEGSVMGSKAAVSVYDPTCKPLTTMELAF